MDRSHISLFTLATAISCMASGLAGAQARGPSAATLRDRAQPVGASPEARAITQVSQDLWLMRLVGLYRATSTSSSRQAMPCPGSGRCDPIALQALTMSSRTEGKGQCDLVGTGTDVVCAIELVPIERTGAAQPARTVFQITRSGMPVDDSGLSPLPIDGKLAMGASLLRLQWLSLKGNTATFKTVCPVPEQRGNAPPDPQWCRQLVRITAKAGSKRVQISLAADSGLQSGGTYSASTWIDLVRQRPALL